MASFCFRLIFLPIKFYLSNSIFNIFSSVRVQLFISCDQILEYRVWCLQILNGKLIPLVGLKANKWIACSKATRNSQVTYKWIANHFLDKFRTNHDWKSIDIMREIHEQLGVKVSRQTCSRAKADARNMIEGSLEDHYH